MNDPVSIELARRAEARWGWPTAIAATLVVHSAAALAIVLAPHGGSHALRLPSVQVRLATLPMPAPPRSSPPTPAQQRATPRAAPATPPTTRAKPSAKPARPRPTAPPSTAEVTARKTAPKAAEQGARSTATGEPSPPESQAEGARVRSGSGALSLGSGDVDAQGSDFPYTYYLERVLGTIEANWFRPAAPEGTSARIRCRIDRSGRLLEAGVEESSSLPAFDRAALRAVYASAPFPPLPQGFDGTALILHLEFGK